VNDLILPERDVSAGDKRANYCFSRAISGGNSDRNLLGYLRFHLLASVPIPGETRFRNEAHGAVTEPVFGHFVCADDPLKPRAERGNSALGPSRGDVHDHEKIRIRSLRPNGFHNRHSERRTV
jgi:hypothetical protein